MACLTASKPCSVKRVQRHNQRAFTYTQGVAGDSFLRQLRMMDSCRPSGGPDPARARASFDYDKAFANPMTAVFERDLTRAESYRYTRWKIGHSVRNSQSTC